YCRKMPKKQVTRRVVARQRSSSTSALAKKDVTEDKNESSSSEDEKESDSDSEVVNRLTKRKTTSSKQIKSKHSSTVTVDKREKQNLVGPETPSSTQRTRTSLWRLCLFCVLGVGIFLLFN